MLLAAAVLLAACASPPAPESGQRPAPGESAAPEAEGPREAAVVVYRQKGRSTEAAVGIAGLAAGTLQEWPAPAPEIDRLLWSPDGRLLAYSAGPRLWLHEAGQEPRLLPSDLANRAATPLVFRPDARQMAVFQARQVVWLDPGGAGEAREANRVALPDGCDPVDLLWPEPQRLFALCYPAPGQEAALLLEIDPAQARVLNRHTLRADRFLGWRPTAPHLLVTRTEFGEEAGAVTASGAFERLRAPDTEAGEFFLAYLPATDRLVFTQGADDSGDPVRLFISQPGYSGTEPWLEGFPNLAAPSFDPDGRWVIFLDKTGFEPDEPGGDVWLAEAGGENPRKVLEASPGTIRYALPALRPR